MKICIPIVAKNKREWIQDAKRIQSIPHDIIEWRIDCMECIEDIFQVAKIIRTYISCPIIATIRNEGNEKKMECISIYKDLMDLHCMDYIDVEILSDFQDLIEYAHQNHIQVVGSIHNFKRSFTNEEWKDVYDRMKQAGVDVYKFACMPQTKKEVIEHLLNTYDLSCSDSTPIISICMGEMGKISRIVSGLFGGSVSFACAHKKSAPGQIEVTLLKSYLKAIDM